MGERISPNTVISLSVNLAEGQKLSDLKLDRKRFRKTKDPELHGYSTYENESEGTSYSVSAEEWYIAASGLARRKMLKHFGAGLREPTIQDEESHVKICALRLYKTQAP